MPTYQGQFVSGQTLNAADLNTFTPAAIYSSSGSLSVPNGTVTKLQFASSGAAGITSWIASANITPNISGWYQVNAFYFSGATANRTALLLYKNNTTNWCSIDIKTGSDGLSVSGLVFLNGTTDNVSAYAYHTTGSAVSYNTYQLACSLVFQ
jgi:hypothetical protein